MQKTRELFKALVRAEDMISWLPKAFGAHTAAVPVGRFLGWCGDGGSGPVPEDVAGAVVLLEHFEKLIVVLPKTGEVQGNHLIHLTSAGAALCAQHWNAQNATTTDRSNAPTTGGER